MWSSAPALEPAGRPWKLAPPAVEPPPAAPLRRRAATRRQHASGQARTTAPPASRRSSRQAGGGHQMAGLFQLVRPVHAIPSCIADAVVFSLLAGGAEYTLAVKTADEPGAGTDAAIWLSLQVCLAEGVGPRRRPAPPVQIQPLPAWLAPADGSFFLSAPFYEGQGSAGQAALLPTHRGYWPRRGGWACRKRAKPRCGRCTGSTAGACASVAAAHSSGWLELLPSPCVRLALIVFACSCSVPRFRSRTRRCCLTLCSTFCWTQMPTTSSRAASRISRRAQWIGGRELEDPSGWLGLRLPPLPTCSYRCPPCAWQMFTEEFIQVTAVCTCGQHLGLTRQCSSCEEPGHQLTC